MSIENEDYNNNNNVNNNYNSNNNEILVNFFHYCNCF